MKSKIAILTACFATLLTTTAFADWDTIGTVTVGPRDNGRDYGRDYGRDNGRDYGRDRDRMGRNDRDINVFNLGGPVEKLQLRAERNDVMCRSVTATFDRGDSRSLFSGPLRQGRPVNVDVPGRSQYIRKLDFNCGTNGRPAAISIIADVGNNNRGAWMRGPDWQSQWSRVFNWGSNTVNDWQMVGSESFEGRNDHETSYAGFRGMRVDSVALKPLEADARCSRVVARFDNGRTQVLALHNRDTLSRGQYEKLDLPGNIRNLASLDLSCSPLNARRVTIQVFTSRG